MPSCPVCAQEMDSHQYQRLASIPLRGDNAEDLDAMLEAVRNHKWDELSRFQDWEGGLDDLEVYFLKCPDGRYNLAVIYDPVALEGDDELLSHEEIHEGDLPPLTEPWKTL